MVEYKKHELEVPKETYEIGEALSSMVSATAKALEDGWQPGQDIPAILVSPVSKLGAALDGIQKVPGEFIEAPVRSVMGIIAPIAKSSEELLKSLRK